MCITVGTGSEIHRSRCGRLWWGLAREPLYLYSAGALLHLTLLAALGWQGNWPQPAPAMLAGLAALPLFGYLLSRLPDLASRSPVHYLLSMGIFLAFSGGLLAAELGGLYGGGWGSAARLLLLLGLLMALRTLGGYWHWMTASRRAAYRNLHWLGHLLGALLGASLLLA